MNMMDHVQLIKSYIHSQNMKWLRMESATDRCAGGVAEGAGRRDVPEDGARPSGAREEGGPLQGACSITPLISDCVACNDHGAGAGWGLT